MKFLMLVVLTLFLGNNVAQTEVVIISKLNDSNYNDKSKLASVDDDLKMSFVISKKINGNTKFYSDIKNFELKDNLINPKMVIDINDLSEKIQISWFKIEEANGDSYNNCSPSWHWEEIPYKETKITEWDNMSIIIPDVKPTIFKPVYCNEKITGSMRFKVTININNTFI
ncbi:MAG: hypothetical protein U9P79_04365, partial [Candidatus Cloacimonadota bacterium]|nr:hypothetical protein [Candidatus Cloacimonadota bacterium]